MKGLVIKKNANLFTVEEFSSNIIYNLPASGKTKEFGVFVGDIVEFNETISKVLERKNLLIRPPLANLDTMFIVIAPSPKPDLILVDKLIVYCFVKGIVPIIIINKIDNASDSFVENIKNIYNKVVKVLCVSAKENVLSSLKENIKGVCAFAGQSAVGKSSLINSIFQTNKAKIGNLSSKIERGKQTTRMIELYKFGKGYIADTAGFSMLSLNVVLDISERELSTYYPDFLDARANCKYRSCLHENGNNCGVVESVKSGKISDVRYQNYIKILQEIKNNKNKR